MSTLRTVALDRIDRDPEQPRKHFDEDALVELTESIKSFGLLSPATLRYSKVSRRYTLVAGERRWIAAGRAKLTEIPALIVGELDDEEAFKRSLAENINRQDMRPLEEAAAFQRIVASGYEPAKVGELYGKTETYVQYRIDLLGLVPAAREVVDKGQLPVGLAWYVCRLGADNQHVFLKKWAAGQFPSFRDAEAYAQACRDQEAEVVLFEVDEPSEEEKARVRDGQRKVLSEVERLERAISAVAALKDLPTADLRQFLAGAPGGIPAIRERLDRVAAMVSRAQSALRKAAAGDELAADLAAAAPAETVAA